MDNQRILVIGATGKVGRHIVTGLSDLGVSVRGLTRHPARLPAGVTAVTGDLSDAEARPEVLRQAAAGADAAFLLWPMLTAAGADAAVAALASQVRHIVYLSAASVHDDAPPEENGLWGQVEQAVERSGAEWTFLRAGGFAANTLGWADGIRSRGVVRWAHGQAARSLIHERDIADVAVLALTEPEHVAAKYVLTGPESITQAEQARLIGEAIGQPVRWEEAPAEEVLAQLAAATGDEAFARHALAYWASLVARPERVTSTVGEITGHPARTFAQWARDHADDFRPRPADA